MSYAWLLLLLVPVFFIPDFDDAEPEPAEGDAGQDNLGRDTRAIVGGTLTNKPSKGVLPDDHTDPVAQPVVRYSTKEVEQKTADVVADVVADIEPAVAPYEANQAVIEKPSAQSDDEIMDAIKGIIGTEAPSGEEKSVETLEAISAADEAAQNASGKEQDLAQTTADTVLDTTDDGWNILKPENDKPITGTRFHLNITQVANGPMAFAQNFDAKMDRLIVDLEGKLQGNASISVGLSDNVDDAVVYLGGVPIAMLGGAHDATAACIEIIR